MKENFGLIAIQQMSVATAVYMSVRTRHCMKHTSQQMF